MKAVSSLVVVILILIIVVSIGSLIYTFLLGTVTSLTETGTTRVGNMSEVMSSCMFVDAVSKNEIYLRNCGEGLITNDTINVYLDDDKLDFSMSPESISKGEFTTISLDLWGLSVGEHKLKITNPKTVSEKIIESILHDSCVLAYDFDEGKGTIVHDESGYKNDGTINGDGDEWIVGKFGKALEFDGIGDYVNIPDNTILQTDTVTVEAWTWLKNTTPEHHQRFVQRTEDSSNVGGWSLQGSGYGDYQFWVYIDGVGWKWKSLGASPLSIEKEWIHLMGTYDGNIVRLYKNGVECIGDSQAGVINEPTSPVNRLMRDHFSTYVEGKIDSVRVYNQALTPEETLIVRMK